MVDDTPTKELRSSKLPLSHQEKSIAELHETISVLTTHLKAVLTPILEENERSETNDNASPLQSPLADQLEANNTGIRKATNKLTALIERLEC